MTVAYFDPVGGASGDMIVASLLDAGASFAELERELAGLPVADEFEVAWEKVAPRHLASVRFHVRTQGNHHHTPQEGRPDAPHGRHLAQIEDIINTSTLKDGVKERACRVFRRLGEAEARVHNTTLDHIHFHEVGAVDSIVDIVGACVALDLLQVERVFVGPLPLSHGIVRCEHGEWPIPGPATMELLHGFRWRQTGIEGELVTPTAAAIFAALGRDAGAMGQVSFALSGFGAGKNDYGIPNVLRVCIGEEAKGSEAREVVIVETSLDDYNPELLEVAMSRLFEAGALDVTITPTHMKKGRPGVVMQALVSPESQDAVVETILRETPTLGVRFWNGRRTCLPRDWRTVRLAEGEVRVKIATLPDGSTRAKPEYDDVKRLAETSGRPAQVLYQEALKALDTQMA